LTQSGFRLDSLAIIHQVGIEKYHTNDTQYWRNPVLMSNKLDREVGSLDLREKIGRGLEARGIAR